MRRAFTLVELMVVIMIIGILLSVVLPTLSSVRSTAQRVACQANLRSLGQAVVMYLDANRDDLPVASNWPSVNTTDTEPFGTLATFLGHPLPAPGSEVEPMDPWDCPADPGLSRVTGFSYEYAPRQAFSILPARVAQQFWRQPTMTVFLDAADWHPDKRNHVRRDGAVGLFPGSLGG